MSTLAYLQNRSLAGRTGHWLEGKSSRLSCVMIATVPLSEGTGHRWVWLQVQFRRKDVNCRKMCRKQFES